MASHSGVASASFGLLLATLLVVAGCAPTGSAPPSATMGSGADAPEVERLLRMADGAERDGNFAIAATFYARALSLAPANAGLAVHLGQLLLDAGDSGPAAEAFARALAIDPNDLQAAKGQGKALLAAGRLNDAAPRLESWHDRLPGDVDFIKLLAVAYDMQQEHDKAIPLYEKGLVIDPTSLSLRSNYGLSLAFSGQTQAGIAVLRPLAQGPASDPRLRQNLALAYGLAGDLKEAERLSRLDLTPDEVETNMSLFKTLRSAMGGKLYPNGIRPGFALAPSTTPLPAASRPAAPSRARATAASPAPRGTAASPKAPQAVLRPTAPRHLTPAPAAPAAPAQPAKTLPSKTAPDPVVGMSLAGGRIGLAPVAPEAGPVDVWFLDLGVYPNEAEAAEAWRAIEAVRPGLRRLAGDGARGVSLIVGPLKDPAGAGSLCKAAKSDRCTPSRI